MLDDNPLSDLSGLDGLPKLNHLEIQYTQVTSFKPLAGLPLVVLLAHHTTPVDLGNPLGAEAQTEQIPAPCSQFHVIESDQGGCAGCVMP